MLDASLLPLAATFAEVARLGSFTEGARRLRLSRSTASDHVAKLEEALGTRLLHRTTRQVVPTEAGERLLEVCEGIFEQWGMATSVLDADRQTLTGTLRVTAPASLCDAVVTPVSATLLREHPALALYVLPEDALLDLVAQGIDLAVRVGQMEDSSFVARKLGEERAWIAVRNGGELAAGLAGLGDPSTILAHLQDLPWVGPPRAPEVIELERGFSRPRAIRVRYRARASTTYGIMRLVLEDVGVAILPDSALRTAGESLRTPLPHHPVALLPIWAVQPSRHWPPRRTRLLMERLEERLREPLWSPL